MNPEKIAPAARTDTTLRVTAAPGEPEDAVLARLSINPSVTAACVSQTYMREVVGDLDVTRLHAAILEETQRVNADDLEGAEAMLAAQAIALNGMFTNLAKKAHEQDMMTKFEVLMRMALRSQSQCRATLETLAKAKNPIIFANQANIAQGPQQVNNTINTRARENETEQTKQMGGRNDEPQWMDHGTTRTPTPSNQALETVGAVHRTTHRKGKGRG